MAETLSNEQKGLITDFKAKAREFWQLWENLDARRAEVATAPAGLQVEYNNLMDRGLGIREKIETVTALIDKAANMYQDAKAWLMDQFGLSGVSYRQLSGLGFIPLIPVAVIGAAVAAIGYWVNDAYQFAAKLDEIKRLEARGVDSATAHQMVEQTFQSGFFAGAGNLVLPVVLGLGLLYFIRKG